MNKLILKFKDRLIKEIEMTGQQIKIGRDEDNAIMIDNIAVSRHHAKIEQVDNKCILTDLNSTNGTFVNDERIKQIELTGGEKIIIGKHSIIFHSDSGSMVEEKASLADFDGTMILDTQQQKDLIARQKKSHVSPAPKKHAKLVISQSGKQQEYALTKDLTVIGKSPSSDVVINGFLVPKVAATIKKEGNFYFISGYGGWIRVNVNGKIAGKKWKLYPNDIIEIRNTEIIFHS